MSGILRIYMLSVVLLLILWQSMKAFADPCAVNNGGCSHLCDSRLSGYGCLCPANFFLGQDHKTCQEPVEVRYNSLQLNNTGALTPDETQGGSKQSSNTDTQSKSRKTVLVGLRRTSLQLNNTDTLKKGTPKTNPPVSGKMFWAITTVLGSLLLFTLIAFAIFCSRTRLRSNGRTRSFDTEEIRGQENLVCRQPTSLQGDGLEMIVMASPQSDEDFNKPHIYSGGHCLLLDNANGRPDSISTDPLDGGTQSEIENELNPLEFSAQGCLNRERVRDESERISQFQPISTIKVDNIDRKTGRKIATVFASRPDPRSDLIYIRFYVYSDSKDSKMRVELTEKERFLDSKPAREQPFRMYNDSNLITVKLTDLEEGWELDKTNDKQIYLYDEANGSGSRSACDFAVKPEDGRDVKGFSCIVRFQLEDDQKEYSIYLNPGFAPVKRQSIRRKTAAGGQTVAAPSDDYAIAGCSRTKRPEEEGEDCDSDNREGRSLPDSSRDNCYVQCDHLFASLGLGNDKPVTENLLNDISPYVGVNWKRVLRKLSIKEAIIKNLEEDCRNAPVDEKCYLGLLAWKNGQGPHGATIKTLCNALRVVGCWEALKALERETAPSISHC